VSDLAKKLANDILRSRVKRAKRRQLNGRQTSCAHEGIGITTLERYVLKGRYQGVTWEINGETGDEYDDSVTRKQQKARHTPPGGAVSWKEQGTTLEAGCRDVCYVPVGDTYYELEAEFNKSQESEYYCALCGLRYTPQYRDDRGSVPYESRLYQ